MAEATETQTQEKSAEATECSICSQEFTNPKLLPCYHTFCLHCLEKDGKDKTQGDQMACPTCGIEFFIPEGGLSNLPDNVLSSKVSKTGRSTSDTAKEGVCDHCLVDALAEMFCIDCQRNLCSTCSKSHKSVEGFENHQVVELGSEQNSKESNSSSGYCDLHPKELIQMYCYEDNVSMCLGCCVESHHSHRCANVDKAAGEFVEQLKADAKAVTSRLAECEEVEQKLDRYEKELTEQVLEAEETIRERAVKLKTLIDEHTESLFKNLKSVTERNAAVFESTRQDIGRFRATIESYSGKSEALLSKGSVIDICRAAAQMHTKAEELENLPANCSGESFRCDAVVFRPSGFEQPLKQCGSTNTVGELLVNESPDRMIRFEVDNSLKHLLKLKSAFQSNFSTVKVFGIPRDATKDMISLYFGNEKLSGGGKHTVVEHHVEEGRAVIKFENPEDALNVSKRRHVLCGAVLRISALGMFLDGIRGCVTEATKGRPGFPSNPFFFRR